MKASLLPSKSQFDYQKRADKEWILRGYEKKTGEHWRSVK